MTARYLIGDVLEVLPTLEAGSVDLVLTSPPFLALRSYLPADHPDKAKEGGSQSTPGAFIDWLVDVVEALDRVLAPHGSMVIELGDTYAGGGGGPDSSDLVDKGHQHSEMNRMTKLMRSNRGAWPADKSLTLIPELFRMTLVYGFNPLTGRQTKRWRLRNVVRWVRPNPPPGALADKFRPATSELMVFCRTDEAGRKRYFDLDSVRTPMTEATEARNAYPFKVTATMAANPNHGDHGREGLPINSPMNPAGAPPLDWWNIPLLDGEEETRYGPGEKPKKVNSDKVMYTSPDRNDGKPGQERYSGGHNLGSPPLDWWNISAEHPNALIEEVAHSLSSDGDSPYWRAVSIVALNATRDFMKGVNPDSGAPLDWWEIPPGGYQGAHYAVFPEALCVRPIKAMCPERVCRTCGEPSRRIVEHTRELFGGDIASHIATGKDGPRGLKSAMGGRGYQVTYDTLGWSDCSHDNYRPGLVLDPFAGSGTTLAVAVGHGRDAIGFDLDERNLELARGRLGMFLEEAYR